MNRARRDRQKANKESKGRVIKDEASLLKPTPADVHLAETAPGTPQKEKKSRRRFLSGKAAAPVVPQRKSAVRLPRKTGRSNSRKS
jgi:hypothetical protein